MMWLKLIGGAIGSFLASIFGSFWHDRTVKSAAHVEDENAVMKAELQTVEKANEVRDEIATHAVPADIAERVRAQYVD